MAWFVVVLIRTSRLVFITVSICFFYSTSKEMVLFNDNAYSVYRHVKNITIDNL